MTNPDTLTADEISDLLDGEDRRDLDWLNDDDYEWSNTR